MVLLIIKILDKRLSLGNLLLIHFENEKEYEERKYFFNNYYICVLYIEGNLNELYFIKFHIKMNL